MKKTRMIYVATSLILLCAMAVNLTGCASKDLMTGIKANAVSPLDDLSTQNAAVTDFAVRLFKASATEGKNTLISPLSVLYALAMTANGAEKETLEEMQSVLGMTTEELNLYMYTYLNSLEQGKKYKLSLANSIWFFYIGGIFHFNVSRSHRCVSGHNVRLTAHYDSNTARSI